MSATNIIRQAKAEGVQLRVTETGTLKVAGDHDVVNRWVPVLKAHKPAIIAELGRPAAVATSWGWRLTLPSGDVVEVFSVPEMSHAEALAFDREATHAEPIKGAAVRPSATRMTTAEETAIRQWLASIGETDPETISEVIASCRADQESRAYFLRQAERNER